MYLSVIIPAYNEEKRLPGTLNDINEYLKKQNYSYEIIVVNDGSRDGTVKVVEDLKPQIANLRLIDNKQNHGKGYVVRQGILEAKGEYRLFTDGDNSTRIEEIEKMWLEFKKGYDIVIGSRDIKGAVIATPQSLIRRILGNIFNIIVQVFIGPWGVWDTQCGFKGFSARAARDIFPKGRINRWAFDPEILAIGKKLGYKIKEVPVVWKNDSATRVKFKGMVKMLCEIFQIKWNLLTHKYQR